jgi:hypothetical protein
MLDSKIATCQCQHCGGALDFETENFVVESCNGPREFGQSVQCPHCGVETKLYRQIFRVPAPKLVSNLVSCPDCHREVSASAFTCPGCGRQFRQPDQVDVSDPVHAVGIAVCCVIGFFVVILVAWAAGAF